VLLGITHYFTFLLTFGELDDAVYVRQGTHVEKENWGDQPEDDVWPQA
jgi:hypothetical protein